MKLWDVIIVGGGAGGFFTAINIKEKQPHLSVLIIEKDKNLLKKVKISGGGRCNVTHACFEPNELVKFYPRGSKELRGPFHKFCTGDMMGWLDDRGVATHIEADNRVFPSTNNSQTIIDLFLKLAARLDIKVNISTRLDAIEKPKNWVLKTGENELHCKHLVMATGSNPKVWKLLQANLNHAIVPPVPSLFTFNIKDERISHLPGVSVPNAHVQINGHKLASNGPLLITHWGLSGPAILKLSAWGAVALNLQKYKFNITVNWLGNESKQACLEQFLLQKTTQGKRKVLASNPYKLPKRLWESLVKHAMQNANKNWADVSKQELNNLANNVAACPLEVKGKSTFKDEFVTAGGVALNEVNFKTFESKLHNNLFFVGEVLNIDAITGGFNFQNCWTGGWIVSERINSLVSQ